MISQHIFYIIETIAILGFALSGMGLAKQKDFDFVGVYIIACVTAFGGGTIRDVILDIQPVYWITHSEYPAIILILGLILCSIKSVTIKDTWLFVPDAIGLSFITVTSAQMAYNAELPLIVVGILTTIVASFGGLFRDVFCQEIPVIFKKQTPLYASLAFIGALTYVMLVSLTTLPNATIMIGCAIGIFVCRCVARKYKIVFPV